MTFSSLSRIVVRDYAVAVSSRSLVPFPRVNECSSPLSIFRRPLEPYNCVLYLIIRVSLSLRFDSHRKHLFRRDARTCPASFRSAETGRPCLAHRRIACPSRKRRSTEDTFRDDAIKGRLSQVNSVISCLSLCSSKASKLIQGFALEYRHYVYMRHFDQGLSKR